MCCTREPRDEKRVRWHMLFDVPLEHISSSVVLIGRCGHGCGSKTTMRLTSVQMVLLGGPFVTNAVHPVVIIISVGVAREVKLAMVSHGGAKVGMVADVLERCMHTNKQCCCHISVPEQADCEKVGHETLPNRSKDRVVPCQRMHKRNVEVYLVDLVVKTGRPPLAVFHATWTEVKLVSICGLGPSMVLARDQEVAKLDGAHDATSSYKNQVKNIIRTGVRMATRQVKDTSLAAHVRPALTPDISSSCLEEGGYNGSKGRSGCCLRSLCFVGGRASININACQSMREACMHAHAALTGAPGGGRGTDPGVRGRQPWGRWLGDQGRACARHRAQLVGRGTDPGVRGRQPMRGVRGRQPNPGGGTVPFFVSPSDTEGGDRDRDRGCSLRIGTQTRHTHTQSARAVLTPARRR